LEIEGSPQHAAGNLRRKELCYLNLARGGLFVLMDADLPNLDEIRGLGVPVASIGRAGTCAGIFLTGIVVVLLANLAGGRPSKSEAKANRRRLMWGPCGSPPGRQKGR